MISVGDTHPRSGWRQRSRASTPVGVQPVEVCLRAVVQAKPARFERRAQSVLEGHPFGRPGGHLRAKS